MTTTTRNTDWHCPRWCEKTYAQHAAESQGVDGGEGGAMHQAEILRNIDDMITVDSYTGPLGGHESPMDEPSVSFRLSFDDATPQRVRMLAHALLLAAELAESK